MHPAVSLTLTLFMTLTIGMPLVGWVISRRPNDRAVNLWFLAIVFDSLQIPIVAAQATFPGWFTYVIPSIITVTAYYVMLLVLDAELKPPRIFWRKVLMVGLSYTAIGTFVFWQADQSSLLIYTVNNLVYLLLALALAIKAFRAGIAKSSLGMYFAGGGFIFGALGYALRAWYHLVLRTSIPVFEFSPASNFLVMTQAVNLVLMTFGYLAYVRDRTEAENIALTVQAADAIARKEVSEKYTRDLLQTIKERDHMVMLNSRFLNLSALAVFNSAIIHEISQPLLAAGMSLDNLRARDAAQGCGLAAEIEETIAITEKAGSIVHALRQMMTGGDGLLDELNVIAEVKSVLPIIEGDARHRGVQTDFILPDHPVLCLCNGVLFQHLIINLVANAFEAFSKAQTPSPALSIVAKEAVADGKPVVVLTVADNGPGLTDEEMTSLFKPFDTQKPDSMGIALALADMLLRKWQGRIVARRASGDSGTIFEIFLPINQSASPPY